MLLDAVDFYCGAGGTVQGAEDSGVVRTRFAANHWPVAIETHSRNFPHIRHACARIDEIHPSEVERLDLLLASPPCPGHSRGRGNKPTTDQERADPWDCMKWLDHHRPEFAMFENVPPFVEWGPIDPKTGRPIKELRGQTFRAWIGAIQAMGYTVEWQVRDPADWGALTSRPRLLILCRLGKRAAKWAEPTHVGSWLSARPAIDMRLKGRPYEGRVVENTMRRIAHGKAMHGDNFIVEYYGASKSVSLDRPLPTITTRDRHGLVIGDTLRMLNNDELKRIQGFPEDYYFAGKRDEITTQIGNSVPPILAKVHCMALAG